MLMKNCNAFDFAHKQIFKNLMRNNLGGGAPFKVGGPVHLHTLHISKATTAHEYLNLVTGKIITSVITSKVKFF